MRSSKDGLVVGLDVLINGLFGLLLLEVHVGLEVYILALERKDRKRLEEQDLDHSHGLSCILSHGIGKVCTTLKVRELTNNKKGEKHEVFGRYFSGRLADSRGRMHNG